MKIVFVSAYPPDKDGIGEYTQRFVESFQHHGHVIEIITPKSRQANGKKIHRIFGLKTQDVKNCLSLIEEFQPDVVHIQYCIALYGLTSFSLIRLIKSLKKISPGITLIITLHEVQREQERLGIVAKYFYRYFLSSFDGLVVHTQAARQTLLDKYQISPDKAAMIALPVVALPPLKSHEAVQELNNIYDLNGKYVLLCFGFIQLDKGIDILIKALSLLKDTELRNKIRLIIAGDIRARHGVFKWFERKDIKYLKSIHNLIDEAGLNGQIIFTGYIKDDDVASFFSRADIITLPYTSIEQSAVLGMAIDANKPIIASRVGGLGETLVNSGLLVSPEQPDQLRDAIMKLHSDIKLSRNLVKEYKKIKQQNSQQAISKKTIVFYERSISSAVPRMSVIETAKQL